jgi:ABC-type uncharacterized transport system permease subunit
MSATLATLAFGLGALLYTASLVLFFAELVRPGRGLPGGRFAPWLLGLAGVLHGTSITLASFVAHVCPVESVHFALSIASLVTVFGYLAARIRYRIDAVGAFVAPIGLTFLLATRFLQLGPPAAKLPPLFLALHVAANVVGDALFLLACVTAGLYLFAEKRLKQKRVTAVLGRLPSLDALDAAEHRFLLIGFPLLTLGIVSGTAWAHKLASGASGEVLRAAFAYLTWIVFAGVLLLRAVAGWRGRRAAVGTLLGFFFAVLVLVVYLVRPAPVPAPVDTPPLASAASIAPAPPAAMNSPAVSVSLARAPLAGEPPPPSTR